MAVGGDGSRRRRRPSGEQRRLDTGGVGAEPRRGPPSVDCVPRVRVYVYRSPYILVLKSELYLSKDDRCSTMYVYIYSI